MAQDIRTSGTVNTMSSINGRQGANRLGSLDAQAIGAVYDQYFPEVYKYALYRVGDQILAEDISSDVFIRLLEAVKNGRGPESNLKGWLIGTASHVVTDHLRKIPAPRAGDFRFPAGPRTQPRDLDGPPRTEPAPARRIFEVDRRTAGCARPALRPGIFARRDSLAHEQERKRRKSPPIPRAGGASPRDWRGGR